jgi:hypothetical protein
MTAPRALAIGADRLHLVEELVHPIDVFVEAGPPAQESGFTAGQW